MIAQNNDPIVKKAIGGRDIWLLDLPDEILMAIMSFLDLSTILNAKLVCKHFDELCDQFVYQYSTILKGRHAVQLAAAFNKNKTRLNWVKSLLVSTKFGEDSGLTRLPPHLGNMRNLEILRLETPDCNSRQSDERVEWIRLQDMYESVFEQSSLLVTDPSQRKLIHLQECTLHFVDLNVELYSLTRYASIFLHPNLRSLTLSCASTDTPDRLSEALQNPTNLQHSTSLERLFLEECDIHAPSLAYLLSFPRALKYFKFSEGVRYDGLFRTGSRRLHGNIPPHHLMDALTRSCSESLESLSLTLGYQRPPTHSIADPGQYLNMTKMMKLRFLEVDNATLQLIRPRLQCDHKMWLRLPQSLQTLKVINIHLSVHLPFEVRREPQIPLETCIIREKAKHGVPNLQTIIYSYNYADDEDENNEFDDFLLLGHGQMPLRDFLANDDLAQDQDDHAADGNPAGVNMGNAMHGQPVQPIHPPQPPAAVGHLPAHLTNNLNIVNPGNLNQAQQFLRQHWFTHANRSRITTPRAQREFTHLEMSKIALLRILNNDLLPQYRQHNTRLIVDMVKLPIGFIPPYLYPEDKPTTYPAWWSSDEAKETEAYKREFSLAREARLFEQNLRRERERRRIEEELHDRRQRLRRGDVLRYAYSRYPQRQRELWRQALAAGVINAADLEDDLDDEFEFDPDNDEDYDDDDDDDDNYDDQDDEEEDDDDDDDDDLRNAIDTDMLVLYPGGENLGDEGISETAGSSLVARQRGSQGNQNQDDGYEIVEGEDDDDNDDDDDDDHVDEGIYLSHNSEPSIVNSSMRATVGDESEEDSNFVDAPLPPPSPPPLS